MTISTGTTEETTKFGDVVDLNFFNIKDTKQLYGNDIIIYDTWVEEDYPTATFWGIEENQVWRGNITINGTVHTNSDIKESAVTFKKTTETFFHANLNLTRDLLYQGPKAVAYMFEIHINSRQYENGTYTLFVHFLDLSGNGMIYHWDIVIKNTTPTITPTITTTTKTTTSIPSITSGFSMLIIAILLPTIAYRRKQGK